MSYAKRFFSLVSVMHSIASEYGRGSRAILWLKMILIVLQARLPRLLRTPRTLHLAFEGKSFDLWITDRTGLAAFEEIFIRKEYKVTHIDSPRSIVDAGANIGVASVYFCLTYPWARLYAIEPDPEVCKTLKKNLAPFALASVHQCALSDVDGQVDLHVHPTSSIASSLYARVPGEKILSVPSRKLETFMQEKGIATIDLLKFDIEGAEDRLLKSISDLKKVRTYVGEIHPDLMQSSLEEIKSLFKGFSVTLDPIGSKRFVLTASQVA